MLYVDDVFFNILCLASSTFEFGTGRDRAISAQALRP